MKTHPFENIQIIPWIMGVSLALGVSAASATPLFMHGFLSSNTNLYSYETSTMTETLIGSTGISNMGGISISGSGALYGMTTSGSLYTLNTTNAAASLVGNSAIGGLEGLTFGLDGVTLYSSGGGSLYAINTSNGAATNLGGIGIGDVDGLTVAPVAVNTIAGAFAAGTIFGTDSNNMFAINPNTLATTIIGTVNASEAISFDAAGILYGHDFSGSLYNINLSTLTGTLIGGTSGPITGLTSGLPLTGGEVPAPATLALFGLGLAGLGWSRRKQRP